MLYLSDYEPTEWERTDLAFVKIKDIVDNNIIIKQTTKTKKSITIKLKQEDFDLVDYSKEWLIDIEATDRSNAYTKLVKRISKRYLGVEMTQTDLRHIKSTELHKSIEHLPLKEQQVLLREQAQKRAHSSQTAISNYIDETDNINISTKYKKSITLLDEDGKIIETFDLLEIIKVMELFRVMKGLINSNS